MVVEMKTIQYIKPLFSFHLPADYDTKIDMHVLGLRNDRDDPIIIDHIHYRDNDIELCLIMIALPPLYTSRKCTCVSVSSPKL